MDYDKKKYKLHKLYVKQLDKTMKQYPPYKVGEENTYTRELSLLNGITKQINELHKNIQEKLSSMSRMIQSSDTAIRQIKKIQTNLSNFTSMDQLDVTSRQMLEDAQEEYDSQRTLFFLKLAVVLLIIFSLVKQQNYKVLGLCVLAALILSFFSNILIDMNSRQGK